MAGYRLYFLVNEHIKHAVTFECETDAEAINAVREHNDGRAMELWCGALMVRRFPIGWDEAIPDPRSDASAGR